MCTHPFDGLSLGTTELFRRFLRPPTSLIGEKLKRMIAAVTALLVTSAMQPTSAQVTKRDPTRSLEKRDPTSALKTFLGSRAQTQNERAAQLESRGVGGDLRELNGLVRAIAVAAPQPAAATSDDLRSRLSDSFITDIAQFLAIHGVKPGDVRRSAPEGAGIVEAASRIIRGTATLADYQRFADLSFVGELQAVEFDPQPAGNYRSTAAVRVVTPLKGSIQPGAVVRIRQSSGRDGDSIIRDVSELQQGSAGSYLLMVSQARLRNTSRPNSSGAADRDGYAYVVVPLKVQDGSILPTSMFPATSVNSLSTR